MAEPEKTTAKQPEARGFVSLNYYRDLPRETNTGTFTASFEATTPFSYYGFVDFSKQSYWSEHNLRYRFGELPLHVSLQYVGSNGLPTHRVRPGVTWTLHQTPGLGDLLARGGVLAAGVIFHLADIDTNFDFRRGGQVEPYVAGFVPGTPLFYEGWLDLDIDFPADKKMELTPVADFLVGANVLGSPTRSGVLGPVAEVRYNQVFKRLREDVPALREDSSFNPLGFELGARYLLLF